TCLGRSFALLLECTLASINEVVHGLLNPDFQLELCVQPVDRRVLPYLGAPCGPLQLSVGLEARLRLHGLILSLMRSRAFARLLSDSVFLISRSAFWVAQAFTSARWAA